jgi:diacylglycerol kinase family enzyme
VFRKPGLVRLLWSVGLCQINRHVDDRSIAYGYAEGVTIEADGPDRAPVQADGDPGGRTPLHVRVLPAALRVIAGAVAAGASPPGDRGPV